MIAERDKPVRHFKKSSRYLRRSKRERFALIEAMEEPHPITDLFPVEFEKQITLNQSTNCQAPRCLRNPGNLKAGLTSLNVEAEAPSRAIMKSFNADKVPKGAKKLRDYTLLSGIAGEYTKN